MITLDKVEELYVSVDKYFAEVANLRLLMKICNISIYFKGENMRSSGQFDETLTDDVRAFLVERQRQRVVEKWTELGNLGIDITGEVDRIAGIVKGVV